MKPSYERLLISVDKIGMVLATTSTLLLLVLVCSNVIARLLEIQFFLMYEYASFLMAFIVLLPLGLITWNAAHLSADFLLNVMGPRMSRLMRRYVIPVGMLCFSLTLTLIAAERTYYAWADSIRSDGPLRTPLIIPQLGMMVGLILLGLTSVLMLFRGDTGSPYGTENEVLHDGDTDLP